ncbi:MAG: hypothetical protein WCC04_14145 [Terriglobales bacterium]
MNTHKAAYLLALVVLAFGLHSEYGHGAFPAVHQAADRAGSRLCRLATHAERAVALAKLLTVRPVVADDDLVAAVNTRELAEDQAALLSEQARSQVESLRDRTQDSTELLRDQVRARTAMIHTLVDLDRARIDQARMRERAQILIRNAANRRVMAINPSSCSSTGSRAAIAFRIESTDGDGDSD